MKTLLKVLCLVSALSVALTFAAELAGVPLPRGFDALTAFVGFALAAITLTVCADYSRAHSLRASRLMATTPSRKASHALAA